MACFDATLRASGARSPAFKTSQLGWSRFRCALVAACFALASNQLPAQDYFQQATYPAAQPATVGPSWQDFNALTARLQATEARLQELSNASSNTRAAAAGNRKQIPRANRRPSRIAP